MDPGTEASRAAIAAERRRSIRFVHLRGRSQAVEVYEPRTGPP
jgi:hypothetical protein